MTNGPMQLVVIAVDDARLQHGVINHLNQLDDSGVIRLADIIFISKNERGDLNEMIPGGPPMDSNNQSGVLASALFGKNRNGSSQPIPPLEIGLLSTEQGEFGLTAQEVDEIADLIPCRSTVAMLLLEHLWAIQLKESIQDADGAVIAQGWITPTTFFAHWQDAVA